MVPGYGFWVGGVGWVEELDEGWVAVVCFVTVGVGVGVGVGVCYGRSRT